MGQNRSEPASPTHTVRPPVVPPSSEVPCTKTVIGAPGPAPPVGAPPVAAPLVPRPPAVLPPHVEVLSSVLGAPPALLAVSPVRALVWPPRASGPLPVCGTHVVVRGRPSMVSWENKRRHHEEHKHLVKTPEGPHIY